MVDISHIQSQLSLQYYSNCCLCAYRSTAFGTALGFALLETLLDAVAGQPELAPMLQVKMFIVAGLLDAISMIAVAVALLFTFNNPFVSAITALIQVN